MTVLAPWIVLALLLTPCAAHGTVGEPRPRSPLEGRWSDDDFTLTVDEDAVQANRDPSKPFEWAALHILNITENMIFFELGGDRFVAVIEGNWMTLSQVGKPGFHVLTRRR